MPAPPDRPALSPLFARIVNEQALLAGWRRVKRNRGGAGGDGQEPRHFARDLKRNIARLARDLAGGSYRPGPLRSWPIAKRDGGVRMLAVPTIRDRVAQTSTAMALAPMLDQLMSPASFAYRAGLSVEQAVALITMYRLRGFRWVVDGDIADFFSSIRHEPLLALLAQMVPCRPTCALIAQWLVGFSPNGRGLAQGSPLSPLLSNLAVSPVDRLIEGKRVRLVRYADDFLLLTRTRAEAEAAAATMSAMIRPLGLTLNPRKTRIAHLDEGIRFLGYTFMRDSLTRTEEKAQSKGPA